MMQVLTSRPVGVAGAGRQSAPARHGKAVMVRLAKYRQVGAWLGGQGEVAS